MALMKREYNNWTVDLGDESIKAEMGEQLKVTDAELSAAINMENVTDVLFARILKNRSKAHQMLLDRVPGARA